MYICTTHSNIHTHRYIDFYLYESKLVSAWVWLCLLFEFVADGCKVYRTLRYTFLLYSLFTFKIFIDEQLSAEKRKTTTHFRFNGPRWLPPQPAVLIR